MRRFRITAILAGITLACILALLINLDLRASNGASGPASVSQASVSQASGDPAIGGPFTLTDGDGHQVTEASFAGDWRLVYFGYTHCPDACPTTLSKLAAALDKLPPAGRAHLRVLFITVDPSRDTPQMIGAYAHAFGPEFVGLTGTQAQLNPVEASYHVYARRHELQGGDYAMDHSSIIYVMAPDGHYAGLLDDSMSPTDLARHLQDFGA